MLSRMFRPRPDQRPVQLLEPKCMVCSDVGVGLKSTNYSSPIWYRSSRTCAFCALIYAVIEPIAKVIEDRSDASCSIYTSESGHLTFKIAWSGSLLFDRFEICRDKVSICPWPSIKPDSVGILNAEAAASCITKWMSVCDDGHQGCHKGQSLQGLPTRVLQIIGTNRVRLHISEKNERGYYVCLSHCWGKVAMSRTTKATYADHQNGISCDSLPATFQHAIELTRRLGLQFIWIDSLCIIQDDLEDWRQEGSRMASIYTNSYITLAASASKDASAGLYRPEDPRIHGYEAYRVPDQAPYNIYVRPWREHTPFLAGTLPLLRRAWFYQERILSTRIVHFGDSELYWECRSKKSCECGDSWPQGFSVESLKVDLPGSQGEDRLNGMQRTHKWQHLVKQYTRLNLTFQSDTFPALQGVASIWQRPETGAYLAGLWRQDLVEGLLWRSQLSGSRPSEFRAPTWSWASVRGWIDWWPDFISEKDKTASIMEVSTTVAGQEPYGEVTAGKLVIKGPCLPARLVYRGSDKFYCPGNCVQLEGHTVEVSVRPYSGDREWFPDLSNNVEKDSEVLLMQMIKIQDTERCIVHFLALKMKHSDDTLYERVGCARTYSSEVLSAFRDQGQEKVVTIV